MHITTLLAVAAMLTPDPSRAYCLETLTGLRSAVEENYAGYRLEVVGDRAKEYERHLDDLLVQAAFAEGDACRGLLMLYLAWFDDPHLFLFQSVSVDSTRAAKRARSLRMEAVTESEVLASVANGGERDPIEGLWYDVGIRMAVVPDTTSASSTYIAVVTRSDSQTLPVGAVRAVFVPLGSGRYAVRLLHETLAETLVVARLHTNGILTLAPAMWGRATATGAAPGLDPSDVRRPTLRPVDGALVVALPSHDPTYRPALDSLIERFAEELEESERLVIDLRANQGGSSWMSDPLLPYLVDGGTPAPYDGREPVMLSSPAQIRYARRAFGSDTTAFVRRLVRSLEESPGELVPLYADTAPPPADPAPEPIHGPERVAVLIDEGTVSASEVLVLKARRSARAVVMGANTAGALDYQSTQVVRIQPGEDRWYLGYPTITAHADLPADGMRGVGIPPHVPVDWTTVEDGVREALRLLEAG